MKKLLEFLKTSLLGGLFILGGDFWDKARALFIHQAKALLPQDLSTDQ